jgi:Flp pilus assembly protein TadG
MDCKMNTSQRKRGLAIVEAALVLPIFVLLVFSVCEYGYLFLSFQYVANAARQGARVAALNGQGQTQGENALVAVLTEGGLTDAGSSVVPIDANTKWLATARVDYTPLFGLVPTPDQLQSTAVMAEEP